MKRYNFVTDSKKKSERCCRFIHSPIFANSLCGDTRESVIWHEAYHLVTPKDPFDAKPAPDWPCNL